MTSQAFEALEKTIVACTRCPRLVFFREHVPVLKRYEEETQWRKPVPGFGDRNAWLLLLGLAPAAQGANRTGRPFTGDESGRFLTQAMYHAGLANQPTSLSRGDGLKLLGCFLTASVKCVPPDNKPLREECVNCKPYFKQELSLLKNLKAVLGLGKLGFDTYQSYLKELGVLKKLTPFAHGAKVEVEGYPTLYGSYHPSPQNTYTKKLTHEMLVSLFEQIKKETLDKRGL